MHKLETKAVLVPLVCFVLVLLHLYFIQITFDYPYNGLAVTREPGSGSWMVTFSDGQGRGARSDIRVGDRILLIDGQDPFKHRTVRKSSEIEQADDLLVERNGVVRNIELKNGRSDLYDFFQFAVGIVCGAGAYFLYRSRLASARQLAPVFLAMTAAFMSIGASSRGDLLGKFLLFNAVSLVPILFFHFLTVFFQEKGRVRSSRKLLLWIYGVYSVFFLLRISFLLPFPTYWMVETDRLLVLAAFSLGIIANGLLVFMEYIRERKAATAYANVVRTVWVALVASFLPFITLSVLPLTLVGKPLVNFIYTEWLMLIFPSSFVYLILAKKLFDIHAVIQRLIYVVIISMFPTFLVASFFNFIVKGKVGFNEILFILVFVMSIFALFLFVLERYSDKLESVLFPRKRVLRMALRSVLDHLKDIRTLRELEHTVLRDLCDALGIVGAAVILNKQGRRESASFGRIGEEELGMEPTGVEALGQKVAVIPIGSGEEFDSRLVLGAKESRTPFTLEENRMLQVVIGYLSVSLENELLLRSLSGGMEEYMSRISAEEEAEGSMWLRKSMFLLQEKERERIAADLHDTVLQDLYFVRQKIGLALHQGLRKTPAGEVLEETVEHLEMVNFGLRETCFQLYPHLLQTSGLAAALRNLTDPERTRNEFSLTANWSADVRIEALEEDTKRHLFRIVQELLNNAKKHSQAAHVSFALLTEDEYAVLRYKDDGKGMETDEPGTTDAPGLGMVQIRNRVRSIRGVLEQRGEPGGGFQLDIRIPLAEGKG